MSIQPHDEVEGVLRFGAQSAKRRGVKKRISVKVGNVLIQSFPSLHAAALRDALGPEYNISEEACDISSSNVAEHIKRDIADRLIITINRI